LNRINGLRDIAEVDPDAAVESDRLNCAGFVPVTIGEHRNYFPIAGIELIRITESPRQGGASFS